MYESFRECFQAVSRPELIHQSRADGVAEARAKHKDLTPVVERRNPDYTFRTVVHDMAR